MLFLRSFAGSFAVNLSAVLVLARLYEQKLLLLNYSCCVNWCSDRYIVVFLLVVDIRCSDPVAMAIAAAVASSTVGVTSDGPVENYTETMQSKLHQTNCTYNYTPALHCHGDLVRLVILKSKVGVVWCRETKLSRNHYQGCVFGEWSSTRKSGKRLADVIFNKHTTVLVYTMLFRNSFVVLPSRLLLFVTILSYNCNNMIMTRFFSKQSTTDLLIFVLHQLTVWALVLISNNLQEDKQQAYTATATADLTWRVTWKSCFENPNYLELKQS